MKKYDNYFFELSFFSPYLKKMYGLKISNSFLKCLKTLICEVHKYHFK